MFVVVRRRLAPRHSKKGSPATGVSALWDAEIGCRDRWKVWESSRLSLRLCACVLTVALVQVHAWEREDGDERKEERERERQKDSKRRKPKASSSTKYQSQSDRKECRVFVCVQRRCHSMLSPSFHRPVPTPTTAAMNPPYGWVAVVSGFGRSGVAVAYVGVLIGKEAEIEGDIFMDS